jgi:hypothetical protein
VFWHGLSQEDILSFCVIRYADSYFVRNLTVVDSRRAQKKYCFDEAYAETSKNSIGGLSNYDYWFMMLISWFAGNPQDFKVFMPDGKVQLCQRSG